MENSVPSRRRKPVDRGGGKLCVFHVFDRHIIEIVPLFCVRDSKEGVEEKFR